ncbi:MAG TPA: PorV/PorQ family protein [Bacteroidota bacterium]|nr:PorV/PorQ family protein [Bacteroidota bacterium]
MKNTMMRSVLCLLLVVSVVAVSDAANPSRIGTAGAQELLIPVGARGIAIGGSSMIFANGVDAIYWNPAGLGRQNSSVEGLFSTMSYFADINVVYGAIGVQAGDFGNLGFSIKSINFGNIAETTTDFPDGTGGQYSPTYITLGATYAKGLTDRIAVGVTANLVTERIMDLSATGVAFNFGLQYHNLAVEGLDLGIAVKNIGTQMQFSGPSLLYTATAGSGLRGTQEYAVEAASADMPSSLELGLGYTRKFDDENSAMIGGMFRSNNYQDDEYNLGAEYNFNNLFFVRGGYTFAPQVNKDVLGANSYIYDYTLGAGLHYNVSGVDLSFDYAYRHMKYFTGNNVVTLKVGF